MISPTPFDLFLNRQDPMDPRLGEHIKRSMVSTVSDLDLANVDLAILGYPDDQGVLLNKGRVGASRAPNVIRKYFYRLTLGMNQQIKPLRICDLGNINTQSLPKESHLRASQVIQEICRQKTIPIVIGGGNDYAYADALGLVQALSPKEKLGIINIDAHMDVRDLKFGITSGTPYFRILNDLGQKIPKGCFIEYAIQPHKSSASHFDFVKKKGGQVVFLEDIQKIGTQKSFAKALLALEKKCHHIIVSLDMDAVCQADAPGVSAPSSNGLNARDIELICSQAGESKKVSLFSIYEVCPGLDVDDRTSRLAATAMWKFLEGFTKRRRLKTKH